MNIKNIPAFIALMGFIPWIYEVVLHPQDVPYASWGVWFILCVCLGILKKIQGKCEPIWFAWAIGDMSIIVLTYLLGGRNWAIESYLGLLILAVCIIILMILYSRTKPKFVELAVAIVIFLGHVPQWFQERSEFAFGVLFAAMCATIAASLTAYNSYAEGKGISHGSVVIIFCPLVLILSLFF